MNIEKAVNRIKWRMESGGWKPNQKDLDAFNEIIKYVNIKEKEQFNNHELFAKLYIFVLTQFIEHYKTNIYDEIPIKELHKLIEQPLSVHIQRFTDKLNDNEVENLYDELKLSKDHPATIPQELRDKETDILYEALKQRENENKFFRLVWEFYTVNEILVVQINNFLNTYYNVNTN